jgi:hypothetical protein
MTAREKLETEVAEMLRVAPFQFLKSLLHFRSGWGAPEKLETKGAEMLPNAATRQPTFTTGISGIPEAEKSEGFLSVSEGMSQLISKCDLEFSHTSTPTRPATLSSGMSAVPQVHRKPGKYAWSGRARLRKLPLAVP